MNGDYAGHVHFSLLAQREDFLVNRPYSQWSRLSNAISNSYSRGYHRECRQYADILKETVDTPTSHIDVMADSAQQVPMNENKRIIYQIVRKVPNLQHSKNPEICWFYHAETDLML